MTPGLAMHDRANRAEVQTVLQPERLVSGIARSVLGAYRPDSVGGEFGSGMLLAAKPTPRLRPAAMPVAVGPPCRVHPEALAIAASGSTGSGHVALVIRDSSGNQVRRIATLPVGDISGGIAIVAGMADAQPIADRAVGELPGELMGAILPATIGEPAIPSIRVGTPQPGPALIGTTLVNLRPEPLGSVGPAPAVPADVAERLPGNPALGSESLRSELSPLAAAALTEAEGNARLRLHLDALTQRWGATPRAVTSSAGVLAFSLYHEW